MRPAGYFLACLSLAALVTGSAPAKTPSDAEAANSLFVEAVSLSREAEKADDADKKRRLLEKARGKLDTLVEEYKGTDVAVKVVTGQKVGNFDPESIDRRLRRLKDGGGGGKDKVETASSDGEKPDIPVGRIDGGGAARRITEGVVAWLEKSLAAEAAPRLALDGKVTARSGDGAARVTFPGAAFVYPDGKRLVVGDVKLRVRPLKEGFYDAALTLPPAMHFEAADGTKRGGVKLGERHFNGTWWAGGEAFVGMDVLVRDLAVTFRREGEPVPALRTRVFRIRQDVSRDGDGKGWSGPYKVRAEGITARELGKGDGVLTADAISLDGRVDGVALERFARINRMIAAQSGDGTPPSRAARGELADLIRDGGLGRLRYGLELDNLKLRARGRDTALDHLKWRMELDTRDRPGKAGITLDLAGLGLPRNLGMETDVPQGLIPETLKFKTTALNLPVARLAARALKQASAGDGPTMKAAEARRLLAEAGLSLRLDRLALTSALSELSVSGNLDYAADSKRDFVGSFHGEITGLQKALKALQEAGTKKAQQAAMALTMVKGFGKAGGKDTYVYDIKVPGEGPVTVNGQPLGGMNGNGGTVN